MFDPRIYRAAFLPALAALVVLLFSIGPAPEPLERPLSTPPFEGREAARLARSIVELAPERTPGSSGDEAVAALVRERFEAVQGGEVAVQSLDSSFDGEDVTLKNVLLTLPGEEEETLLVVAARDSAEGAGATTSATDTAALLSLADDLGGSRHRQTIVLASTSGGSDGAIGARLLVDSLSVRAEVTAAVALTQSGVARTASPLVLTHAGALDSPPAGLVATAAAIASIQFERAALETGLWRELSRLAVPTAIGEHAALAAEGADAIGLSAGGERPPEDDDDPSAISAETMLKAGTTALALVLTLDEEAAPPEQGPGTYLLVGGNTVPGWALGLLGLSLIAPALLAAGDGWLRERRREPRLARRALPWALERALLPLAALLLTYALGILGLIPDPRFPFDPGRFPAGVEGPFAYVALALAVTLSALLIRPMRTPLDAEPMTLAAAGGLLASVSVLLLWLLNPYLGLLLAPAAHVWLLPARAAGSPRPTIVAVAALLSLAPALAAGVTVASALGIGAEAPWQLLLLIESGQVGFVSALVWCGVLGGLIACVAAAGARPQTSPVTRPLSVRGPAGYAGPGALGESGSKLIRR